MNLATNPDDNPATPASPTITHRAPLACSDGGAHTEREESRVSDTSGGPGRSRAATQYVDGARVSCTAMQATITLLRDAPGKKPNGRAPSLYRERASQSSFDLAAALAVSTSFRR